MDHSCVVMMATHDLRPAGRMFDMPDIVYVFLISNFRHVLNLTEGSDAGEIPKRKYTRVFFLYSACFLHLETVYHISKCKNNSE
jgi:hypothetical protein